MEPSKTRKVLEPSTAAVMTDILRDAVCTGTGEKAKVKGMEVAGKTGTGYKVQDNGTYNTDAGGRRYFASFVGFFPAQEPRVTMLVSIDEPNSSSIDRFGGTAAAPAETLYSAARAQVCGQRRGLQYMEQFAPPAQPQRAQYRSIQIP